MLLIGDEKDEDKSDSRRKIFSPGTVLVSYFSKFNWSLWFPLRSVSCWFSRVFYLSTKTIFHNDHCEIEPLLKVKYPTLSSYKENHATTSPSKSVQGSRFPDILLIIADILKLSIFPTSTQNSIHSFKILHPEWKIRIVTLFISCNMEGLHMKVLISSRYCYITLRFLLKESKLFSFEYLNHTGQKWTSIQLSIEHHLTYNSFSASMLPVLPLTATNSVSNMSVAPPAI